MRRFPYLLAILIVFVLGVMGGPLAPAGEFYDQSAAERAEALRRSSSDYETGILSGGALSVNVDPTKFDVSAGEGIVVDKSDPANPIFTEVEISSRLAVVDLFPAMTTTWVLIDANDVLSQHPAEPTPLQRRDNMFVGSLVKAGGIIVLAVDNRVPAWGMSKTSEDFFFMLGGMASGAEPSANSDLSIDVTAGQIISIGAGRNASLKTPNTDATPAQTPVPVGRFFKVYENAVGALVLNAASNQLDPNQYNAAGTLTAVPAGNYTIQRLFLFPETDGLAVYYGNTLFGTLAEAASQLETEVWSEHPDTRPAAFRGWVILEEGTADLAAASAADPATAAIVISGPLRPGIIDSSMLPVGQIIAQITDSSSQKPGVTTPVVVTFDAHTVLEGMAHDRPEDIKALTAAKLHLSVQYQVERTGSGGIVLWHGWLRQGRRDGAVESVSVANPSNIESGDHRMQTGQTVTISGCTTTPDITGAHVVTVVDANNVTIPVDVTAVTDGTCVWTRALDAADDLVGSNSEEALLTVSQSGLATSVFNVQPMAEDVFNVMQSIDTIGKGAGLVAKTPAGEPAIPSARISVTQAGGQ